jgi:oligosaccharide repeat unit polymerase
MTYAVAYLLALAVTARSIEGSWFAPGALFAGYWAAWMFAACLLGTGWKVPAAGPAFITAAAVAVVAGSYVGTPREGGRERGTATASDSAMAGGAAAAVPSVGPLIVSAVAGSGAGLLATFLTFRESGSSLSALTTQAGLFQVGNTLAVQRYSGEQPSLGFVPLLLGIAYAGAFAAPFLLFIPKPGRPRWWRALVLGPVASTLTFSVVTTARLPVLLAACFTFLSCVVAISMRQGEFVRLRATHVLAVIAAAGAVAVAFVFIAFIRVGPSAGSDRPVIFNGFKVYAVGHVSSFSQWFAQPSLDAAQSSSPLALGAATFGALARQLGMDPTLSQAYQDSRQLGSDPGTTTNIYTAFRAAIVDFGAPGALLFYAVIGFVAARVSASALSRPGPVSGLLLVVLYSYFLNGNSQSIFWFTNICLAILIAGLCLTWSFRRSRARSKVVAVVPDVLPSASPVSIR